MVEPHGNHHVSGSDVLCNGMRDDAFIQENRSEHECLLEAGVEILGIVSAIVLQGIGVFPSFSP